MTAYRGFLKNLTCRGFQFHEHKVNRTNEANCQRNGFHCAEDPLDCLTYYPDYKRSVYYTVEASGDIHETEGDSKIACTKMRLVKRLSFLVLLLEGVSYMMRYPNRQWSKNVTLEQGRAGDGYVVVRGKNPTACGGLGDILVLVREELQGCDILEVSVYVIDGNTYMPGVWYDMDSNERERRAEA